MHWFPEGLRADDCWATGQLFLDGSGMLQGTPLARADWGVCQIGECGRCVRACYGAVPWDVSPHQLPRDAEDWAVHQASIFMWGHVVLHIDCAGTVGVASVPGSGTRPCDKRAHIWGPTWTRAEAFNVVKVKAHTSMAEASEMGLEWQRLGNAEADRYAKMGARFHRLPQGILDEVAALEMVQGEHLRWIGCQEALRVDRGWADTEVVDWASRPLSCKPWLHSSFSVFTGKVRHHELAAARFGYMEHMGHRLLSAPIVGLNVVHQGAVAICTSCGAYAHEKSCDLSLHCSGRLSMSASRKRRLARFFAGRHPRESVTARLGQAKACSLAAYTFLQKRWGKLAALSATVVSGYNVDEWGTDTWRRGILASSGLQLDQARAMGASMREERERRSAARRRRSGAVASDSD